MDRTQNSEEQRQNSHESAAMDRQPFVLPTKDEHIDFDCYVSPDAERLNERAGWVAPRDAVYYRKGKCLGRFKAGELIPLREENMLGQSEEKMLEREYAGHVGRPSAPMAPPVIGLLQELYARMERLQCLTLQTMDKMGIQVDNQKNPTGVNQPHVLGLLDGIADLLRKVEQNVERANDALGSM